MARSLLPPILLRGVRVAALLLPAVVLAVTVGCGHHKRTSLRPVYSPLSPSSASPCPSGDCGAGTISPAPASSGVGSSPTSSIDPAVMESGASGSTVLPGRSITSTPSAVPVAPAAPARSSDTPPPVSGPIMPGFSEEPGLSKDQADGPAKTPAPKPSQGNSSVSPSASLKAPGANGKKSAPGRLRSASLRDDLTQYTNDPEDLFLPPKADRPWKYIVLHHSAGETGGYDSIDREHRKRLGWQGCGYHFIIGNGSESPDGRIEVSQRWLNQKHGVHCRDGKTSDVSEYGIGICLVGDLETAAPTDRQVAAARALIAYLSDRYQIAADRAETHSHLAASPTTCPGKMFPAQAILGTKGLTIR